MKGLYYIFLLFCFFPYIDIINIGTDTQPNALIAATVLLFAIPHKQMSRAMLLLWLMFCFSLVLAVFSSLSAFETLKNVLNYLSPALISFAAYNLFIKNRVQLGFKFFLLITLAYFFTAFIQMYVNPDFLSGVLNQGGRGAMLAGRGVVSLCPEPAFYGSICLFFIVFSLLSFNRKQNFILVPLLVFQLVFFSRSATSILIFLLALGLFLTVQVFKLRPVYIITALILIISGNFIKSQLDIQAEKSRAAGLLTEFIENPSLISQVDVSAGVRIMSSVSPFLALKHKAFLPMGMGSYKPFAREIYRSGEYPRLINLYILNEIGRLGGGINMVLFHLGFIGLIFPAALFMIFKPLLSKNAGLLAFLLFVCILFTQIQLMHAMIGLLIALAASKTYTLNLSGDYVGK